MGGIVVVDGVGDMCGPEAFALVSASVAAGVADGQCVRIENEGYEACLSFYLYGLVGLALLTVVSPLFIVSVPLLVLIGPVSVAWWLRRNRSWRLRRGGRLYLIVVSAIVAAAPVTPAIWYLFTVESDASISGARGPDESFWLILIGLCLSPMFISALAYHLRAGAKNGA